MFPDLNDENFEMFSLKAYNSPLYLMEEYYADIKRIKYIKRLFGKYRSGGELKERLILNHLIVLYNVFSAEPATRMLFLKVDQQDWPLLKTFLTYLNFMPDVIKGIRGYNIITNSINIDEILLGKLQNV